MDEEHRIRMVDKVVELMKAVEVKPNEKLIEQGQAGDAFYLI